MPIVCLFMWFFFVVTSSRRLTHHFSVVRLSQRRQHGFLATFPSSLFEHMWVFICRILFLFATYIFAFATHLHTYGFMNFALNINIFF